MRIVIMGRGVIGVTYGCVLREAGHEVQHLLRDADPRARPATTTVDLLDGREQPPVDRSFRYPLTPVTFDPETVDLVLVSVPAEALAARVMVLMFRKDVLSRRIMELHHNTDDILALMSEVHVSATESAVPVPGFTRDLGRARDALAS
ncbi:ketopantoate reductase family protein [Plantibacter auratus]|uniref:ketopantoate reductase family protein n=1 Tax=Plantibacter auratus TaxID=272914 RepID=UPI003D348DEA